MAGQNILVLNSSSLITGELQQSIINQGYNIKILRNYNEFKTSTKGFMPHLIILEVTSAVEDILKFKNAVDDIAKLHNVPCLAIVSHIDRTNAVILARMGFQEILIAPVDETKLMSILNKIISKVNDGDFFIVKEKSTDQNVTIEIINHLDASNSKNLENFIDHLIVKKGILNLVFDFKNVKYLDSSGIGVLVVCKKKLDMLQGELQLINTNNQINTLLATLQLDKILEISG